jgi:hypothetical protein
MYELLAPHIAESVSLPHREPPMPLSSEHLALLKRMSERLEHNQPPITDEDRWDAMYLLMQLVLSPMFRKAHFLQFRLYAGERIAAAPDVIDPYGMDADLHSMLPKHLQDAAENGPFSGDGWSADHLFFLLTHEAACHYFVVWVNEHSPEWYVDLFDMRRGRMLEAGMKELTLHTKQTSVKLDT